MSRISIEVTPEQHKAIKAMALLEGVPIKTLLWAPLEKKLLKAQAQAKKRKGYGAGHPDCPLCQKYAKNGRYNAKTERGIAQSLKEIKAGKLKSYKTAKELFDEYR